jgi:hypothetical protein
VAVLSVLSLTARLVAGKIPHFKLSRFIAKPLFSFLSLEDPKEGKIHFKLPIFMVNKIGGKLGTVLSVSTGEVKYRCRFSFSWSSLLFRSLLARIGQTVILYARRQTPDGGRTANQNENIESESHDFHFDVNLAIVDVCRPLSCVMVVACGCSVPCPADPRIRTHVSQKE